MVDRFEGRYDRNKTSISEDEQLILAQKRVCVIGCGGLGGGVIEGLTRLGIGHLTVVDCDVFDATNLNRQVLSNEKNIGLPKADEAKKQMREINSLVEVTSVQARLTSENARSIIRGHDAVVDALDNIAARLVLEDACEEERIPLVHGAIAGWNGQVAVVMPGRRLLHELYGECGPEDDVKPVEGNPAFTPAVVSAIETAETLKLLLGRESVLQKSFLLIDLMTQEYDVIS